MYAERMCWNKQRERVKKSLVEDWNIKIKSVVILKVLPPVFYCMMHIES